MTAPGGSPPGTGLAEPVCLNWGGDDMLMMYESAAGEARETAILFCPPFGWQYACAYRGLRSWGRSLTAVGHAVARLDLPSTGDSAGTADDPERLTAWIEAARAAAAWLRASAGATRVCAIGLGLGGMVATAAAADGAIDDLVLWAVPARGRALVREMRAYAAIVADEPDPGTDGDLMLVGYRLSAETSAALSSLDLRSLVFGNGAGRRALLLGRDGVRPDPTLEAHLREAGLAVCTADGRDYATLMGNPQDSLTPRATIALTAEWLADGEQGGRRPSGAPATARADTGTITRAPVVSCRHGETALAERPLWLRGVRGDIFAVVTEPAAPARDGSCAVLLGGGALPHTGPNRSWVQLARAWAASGVATVRLDLGGVGESEGDDLEIEADASYYDPWRDGEVAAVLDQLQEAGIGRRFILGGLCSGAYRALRRGLVDERVTGLLLLNLFAVEWSQELVTERGRRDVISGGASGVLERVRDPARLATALRGVRPDRAWRLVRRSAEREERQAIIAAFDTLTARRVVTQLLFVEGEPMLAGLERHGLIAQLPRWPELEVVRVPSHDHMFRARLAQRFVHAELGRAVRRAAGPRGTGSGPASGEQ